MGAAPDIHVSLVMLPEECKELSDKRYPFGDMKLKVMSKMVRYSLEKKMKHLEQMYGPPRPQLAAARTGDPGASASV